MDEISFEKKNSKEILEEIFTTTISNCKTRSYKIKMIQQNDNMMMKI